MDGSQDGAQVMQSKVFSFLNITDGSVIPSVRIARMVADELGLPLVDSRTMNDDAVDVLFIVNGAYAFCSCLETLGTAIERAQRVVWIQNDYTIIPPKKVGSAESPFRKAFRNRFDQGKPDTDFWSTCEDFAKLTSGSCLINWNCLTEEAARRGQRSAPVLRQLPCRPEEALRPLLHRPARGGRHLVAEPQVP
jgi:hypothetical protein